MAKKVILSVGTKRGLFLMESGTRRAAWKVSGPFLKGWTVPYAIIDTRGTPRLHVSASHFAYGSTAYTADIAGKSFTAAKKLPEYPTLNRKAAQFVKKYGLPDPKHIWVITPGHEKQKKVLFCGTSPAGLFRSDDGGTSWEPVTALNEHRTRKDWSPGAGGQALHSLQVDPEDPDRMYVAISAAGAFRTEDGGKKWTPINTAVAQYVGAPKESEVGSCVHKLLVHPAKPGLLYQQNHVGVYRSENHGTTWQRIDEGLPYDFGFGLAVHPTDPTACYVLPLEPQEYNFRATDGALNVYRSQGKGWRKLTKGLPRKNAYLSVLRQAMDSDHMNPCGVYFGTAGGTVFASADDGMSWSVAADYLPPIQSVTAAVVG
ncbi:MAG: hypothetical protein R3E12_10955 [Candidatus Eisenbacteria bacterium]